MHHTALPLILALSLALAAPIVANKLYYTTWAEQPPVINSSLVYVDATTSQQGVLYTVPLVVILSAYNSKANVFHLVANDLNVVHLITIDMQGNLISKVQTAIDLQCLKYSASQNTLIGATMSNTGLVNLGTIDYTTGQLRQMLTLPAPQYGDLIRSCDIDDQTGRLVLHRQNSDDYERLTVWDYNANTVVGQYTVVFNNSPNNYKFLANVAFSGSQLACIVGTSGNSSWLVQLGKFNLNGATGNVTPVLITQQPVTSFVVGFAWNADTSMFNTLGQDHPNDFARPWTIDTYDRNGVRVNQTRVLLTKILQPRDLQVVL